MFALALIVAVAAAVRSTWSPCGLSMLSTITPLAERSRGRRYGQTASWFVAGSTLGGLTTGSLAALLAIGWHRLGATATVALLVGAVSAVGALLVDAGWPRSSIPHHRRQVNEQWLEQFRSWVYGSGFGWQIGTGLATYIMTAGVYLWIVLAALTGSPVRALVTGAVFGGVRGLAILLTAGVAAPQQLMTLHSWFEARREQIRRGVVAVEGATVIACLGAASVPLGVTLVVGVLAAVVWWNDRQLSLEPSVPLSAVGSKSRAKEFMQ